MKRSLAGSFLSTQDGVDVTNCDIQYKVDPLP